ncbi:MAG TPA: ParA family protein [Solirubrobacterales bacterium]|nr:ParA family protein [Solirubrobacterales bacterium]
MTNWRQRRSDFPEPLAELKSGPIWDRDAISNWAAESGLDTIADAGVEDEEDEPQRAGVTIAVMNMKGGVGKSTLTANLGWYAAYRRDQRVLLVDLDPQFNLSQYVLGTAKYEEHLENERLTVLDIFEQASPPDPSGKRKKRLEPADVIANVREWHDGSRLDLVPSSLQLSFTLKNPASKEQLLKHFLDEVRSAYDLILIDCAPTESILTMAAYSACNAVLIPVKPEFLSTIGLPLVVNSLDEFKSLYKKEVDVLGIVFNASAPKLEDQRSRSFVRQIAKQHSWPVFRNAVSQSDSYPKGSRFGTPIFLTNHARTSKIEDFEAVAEEFFERLETIG